MTRADRLFTRLRAARLDHTLDAEFRRLTRLDLLIIDLSRPCDDPDTGHWDAREALRCLGSQDLGIGIGRDNHRPSRNARRLSGGW